MSTKIKVGVFDLTQLEDIETYESLLNTESITITGQKENFDKLGRVTVLCYWEVENDEVM